MRCDAPRAASFLAPAHPPRVHRAAVVVEAGVPFQEQGVDAAEYGGKAVHVARAAHVTGFILWAG